jgi:hypothetical protein
VEVVFTREDVAELADKMETTRSGSHAAALSESTDEMETTGSLAVSGDQEARCSGTLDAIAELDRGGLKAYDSSDELFRDLEAGGC